MSSRQEEKERRRREREEQEAKAASSAASTRRLQIVGGAVLAIAVVAVVIVLITSGGGSDEGDASSSSSSAAAAVTLPARKIENLQEAAEAGGCTYEEVPNEGSTHTQDKVEYTSNPPTSGDHNPVPAEDGVYAPGNSPEPEAYVHSLEHGRIIFQYQPGASDEVRGTLEAIFNEEVNGTPGYHAIVLENNTGMKTAVAATAWDQKLTCPELTDAGIDAMRAFRDRFTDKGPEFVP